MAEPLTEPLFLALDVGNTAAKGALYAGARRVRTFSPASPEDLADALGGDRPAAVGLASVVPRRSAAFAAWVERTLGVRPVAVGSGLALLVNRRFALIPLVVGGFLLQHAVQGWCPPVPVLRRLGFRTPNEIDAERFALMLHRGDFDGHEKRPSETFETIVN